MLMERKFPMIGERLKKLRGKKSQEAVSEKIGISRARLSHYETGRSEPDSETLKKLADYYDVSTDFLITGIENESISVAGQEVKLSPEELKVFEELKKHPILFNDLASDPEKKIKELIKLYKMKKMFLEEEEEEYGNGFGELED